MTDSYSTSNSTSNGGSMDTRELIELTTLHALGLLDEDERERYEASMVAAPEGVRAQILDEARRMADLGDLLPPDEPRHEMREMVLAAVRAAAREQENEARIATGGQTAPVAGRIDREPRAPRGHTQPRMSRAPKVHRFWRAATIGFAAALIVISVVSINNMQSIRQSEPDTLVMQLYDNIGGEFLEATIFDANTTRVAMVSPDASSNSVAAVWHNPDWNSARLFIKNMRSEDGTPYRLVVLGEDGEVVREVASFISDGEFENLEVRVNLDAERRLAIYESVADSLDDERPLLESVDQSL